MIHEFELPDPGEGLVEAEIVTWRVAVGDQVKVNDIVVEIETAKSLVELPIPYAGTVTALLVDEGQMADVGSPIIRVSDGADEPADAPQAGSPSKTDLMPPVPGERVETDAAAANGGRTPNLVGYGPRTTEARRRPRATPAHAATSSEPAAATSPEPAAEAVPAQAPVSATALPAEPEAPASPAPTAPVSPAALAKPPVRKLAKDRGIDLTTLTGTGPGGVVTREDVERASGVGGEQASAVDRERASGVTGERASEAGEDLGSVVTPVGPVPTATPGPVPPPSVAAAGARGAETRAPIKGVRKATADAMVRSAFTAPHVTEWVTCDVTATMELVDRLRERREFRGVKISPLLVVAKAVCVALGRVPSMNSFWDEAAQEIAVLHYVNLGIAAATPRGLVVPNIKGADALSLLELAHAINGIVGTAREGRTQPADMSGGTFTLTNVGTFGVDAGTPILNPGESGILCIGQIARRPWVVGTGREERVEPRWVTTLAVSFDHRLIDGEQGSVFLSTVAQILTDPGLGLLF